MPAVSQPQSRVIWKHPRGRFVVIETSGVNAMGGSYAIREAVLTPEHDRRGQVRERINRKVFRSGAADPVKPHGNVKPLTRVEKTMIMDMYYTGWPTTKIARSLHRGFDIVQDYIEAEKEKAAPEAGPSRTAREVDSPL